MEIIYYMTATKEQVKAIIEDFIREYDGKHIIWGITVGAGSREYDEYGKPRHRNKNDYIDWALHVFIDNEEDRDRIPSFYKGIPLLVFVTEKDISEDQKEHAWSQTDLQKL